MSGISLSEYRSLMAQNHGQALGILMNLDAATIASIGIDYFIVEAAEIFKKYSEIMALEIDYSK